MIRETSAAMAVFHAFAFEGAAVRDSPNALELFFDPRMWRPFVVDWAQVGQALIARLHRSTLLKGGARPSTLLDRLLAYPGVPAEWRHPDSRSRRRSRPPPRSV